MSSEVYVLIRLVHVLLGAAWFGGLVLLVLFVMPSIAQSGPAGGQVMGTMVRRGFASFMPSIAGLAVVSGIILYWRFTGGFDTAVMTTHGGMAFGIGGLFGLTALIIGSAITGPGNKALVRLGGEMARMPDGPDKVVTLQRIAALRHRVTTTSRLVLVLVTITMVVMTLGHRV
jgi:uncharacterized membrane protein